MESEAIVKVATPDVTNCVERTVIPSKKVTFPVAALLDIVAVNVTDVSNNTFADDVVSDIFVGANVTACINTLDVDVAYVASPL